MNFLVILWVITTSEIVSSAANCQLPVYFRNRRFLEHVTPPSYSTTEFRNDHIVVYTRTQRTVNGTCQDARQDGRRLIYLTQNDDCFLVTMMKHDRAVLIETKSSQASIDACVAAPTTNTHFTLMPAVDGLDNHVACPFNRGIYQTEVSDNTGTSHCVDDSASYVTISASVITFHVCQIAVPVSRPPSDMHCADHLAGSFTDRNSSGGVLLLNAFQPNAVFPSKSYCARYTIDTDVIRISIASAELQPGMVSAYCPKDLTSRTSTTSTFTLILSVSPVRRPVNTHSPITTNINIITGAATGAATRTGTVSTSPPVTTSAPKLWHRLSIVIPASAVFCLLLFGGLGVGIYACRHLQRSRDDESELSSMGNGTSLFGAPHAIDRSLGGLSTLTDTLTRRPGDDTLTMSGGGRSRRYGEESRTVDTIGADTTFDTSYGDDSRMSDSTRRKSSIMQNSRLSGQSLGTPLAHSSLMDMPDGKKNDLSLTVPSDSSKDPTSKKDGTGTVGPKSEAGKGKRKRSDDANDVTSPSKSTKGEQSVKSNGKKDNKVDTKTDAKKDTKVDTKADAKNDAKADTKKDAKADTKKDAKVDVKKDTKPDAKKDTKSDVKKDTKSDVKKDTKSDTKKDTKENAKKDPKAKQSAAKKVVASKAQKKSPRGKSPNPSGKSSPAQTSKASSKKSVSRGSGRKK